MRIYLLCNTGRINGMPFNGTCCSAAMSTFQILQCNFPLPETTARMEWVWIANSPGQGHLHEPHLQASDQDTSAVKGPLDSESAHCTKSCVHVGYLGKLSTQRLQQKPERHGTDVSSPSHRWQAERLVKSAEARSTRKRREQSQPEVEGRTWRMRLGRGPAGAQRRAANRRHARTCPALNHWVRTREDRRLGCFLRICSGSCCSACLCSCCRLR